MFRFCHIQVPHSRADLVAGAHGPSGLLSEQPIHPLTVKETNPQSRRDIVISTCTAHKCACYSTCISMIADECQLPCRGVIRSRGGVATARPETSIGDLPYSRSVHTACNALVYYACGWRRRDSKSVSTVHSVLRLTRAVDALGHTTCSNRQQTRVNRLSWD
jgi:hypothetical protein